ncbi:hypothetical protein RRG08_002942 [Elysia crispata]|uniref:Uncharacterized protein n=1 Tax=Elysia crispata TaxID=231223 RepID=A0AAE1APG1_9GAST|nr:hypothetical protein RRG08_002942 [Elysia crispata]
MNNQTHVRTRTVCLSKVIATYRLSKLLRQMKNLNISTELSFVDLLSTMRLIGYLATLQKVVQFSKVLSV